jgi:hypothetical protein
MRWTSTMQQTCAAKQEPVMDCDKETVHALQP